MNKQGKQFSAVVGGKVFTFETGKLAGQANGAVTVRLGDSMIFCAVTMGPVREGLDFFPMTAIVSPVLSSAAKGDPAVSRF